MTTAIKIGQLLSRIDESVEINEAIAINWVQTGDDDHRLKKWLDMVSEKYNKLMGDYVREDVFKIGGQYQFILVFEKAVLGVVGYDVEAKKGKVTHAARIKQMASKNGKWKLTNENKLSSTSGVVIDPIPDDIKSMKQLADYLADNDGLEGGSKFDTDGPSPGQVAATKFPTDRGEMSKIFNQQVKDAGVKEIQVFGNVVYAFDNPIVKEVNSRLKSSKTFKIKDLNSEYESYYSVTSQIDDTKGYIKVPFYDSSRVTFDFTVYGDRYLEVSEELLGCLVRSTSSVKAVEEPDDRAPKMADTSGLLHSPPYENGTKVKVLSRYSGKLIDAEIWRPAVNGEQRVAYRDSSGMPSVGTFKVSDIFLRPRAPEAKTYKEGDEVTVRFSGTTELFEGTILKQGARSDLYHVSYAAHDSLYSSVFTISDIFPRDQKTTTKPVGSQTTADKIDDLLGRTAPKESPEEAGNRIKAELNELYGVKNWDDVGRYDPIFQASFWKGEVSFSFDITDKRNTSLGMFRELTREVRKGNDVLKSVFDKYSKAGYKCEIGLCTEADCKESDSFREMDHGTSYSEMEVSIGGGVKITL